MSSLTIFEPALEMLEGFPVVFHMKLALTVLIKIQYLHLYEVHNSLLSIVIVYL